MKYLKRELSKCVYRLWRRLICVSSVPGPNIHIDLMRRWVVKITWLISDLIVSTKKSTYFLFHPCVTLYKLYIIFASWFLLAWLSFWLSPYILYYSFLSAFTLHYDWLADSAVCSVPLWLHSLHFSSSPLFFFWPSLSWFPPKPQLCENLAKFILKASPLLTENGQIKMFCLFHFFLLNVKRVETSLHLLSFSLWSMLPPCSSKCHMHPLYCISSILIPTRDYLSLLLQAHILLWPQWLKNICDIFCPFSFYLRPRNLFLPTGHGGPLLTSSSPSDCHCSSFPFQLPGTINCPSV